MLLQLWTCEVEQEIIKLDKNFPNWHQKRMSHIPNKTLVSV